jgi:hypothetical protein
MTGEGTTWDLYATSNLFVAQHAATPVIVANGAGGVGTRKSFVARALQGATADIMLGGVAGVQTNTSSEPAHSWDVLSVGSGAYIGPLAICPARITDAETAQLDAMLTAGARGTDLFKWFQRRGYDGTLILPLEGDSRGYIVGCGGVGDNYSYSEVAATTDSGFEQYV